MRLWNRYRKNLSRSVQELVRGLLAVVTIAKYLLSFLGQEGKVLDQYGGTDILQIPVSHLTISEGKSEISCVRFSPKGMVSLVCEVLATHQLEIHLVLVVHLLGLFIVSWTKRQRVRWI